MAIERLDEVVLVFQKQRRQRAKPSNIRIIKLEKRQPAPEIIRIFAALVGRGGG